MKSLNLFHSSRGFTLIELIIVIAIISVLLAGGSNLPLLLQLIEEQVPGLAPLIQTTSLVDKNQISHGDAIFFGVATTPTNNQGTLSLGASLNENSDWRIKKAQYHLGLSPNDIPQNKTGAPIPGHFAYSQDFTTGRLGFSNTVTLPDTADHICNNYGGDIVVTMKLELEEDDGEGNVIEKTVWIEGTPFTKGWGQYTTNTLFGC